MKLVKILTATSALGVSVAIAITLNRDYVEKKKKKKEGKEGGLPLKKRNLLSRLLINSLIGATWPISIPVIGTLVIAAAGSFQRGMG